MSPDNDKPSDRGANKQPYSTVSSVVTTTKVVVIVENAAPARNARSPSMITDSKSFEMAYETALDGVCAGLAEKLVLDEKNLREGVETIPSQNEEGAIIGEGIESATNTNNNDEASPHDLHENASMTATNSNANVTTSNNDGENDTLGECIEASTSGVQGEAASTQRLATPATPSASAGTYTSAFGTRAGNTSQPTSTVAMNMLTPIGPCPTAPQLQQTAVFAPFASAMKNETTNQSATRKKDSEVAHLPRFIGAPSCITPKDADASGKGAENSGRKKEKRGGRAILKTVKTRLAIKKKDPKSEGDDH